MAFTQVISTLALLLATVSVAQATVHIVGDHYGWTLHFDYAAWAKGKDFRVGDKLVFNYPVQKHNVFKASGPEFDACQESPTNVAMTSGKDIVTLTTPGRKWYICGIGNHCQMGMKLFIIVKPAVGTPSSALPRTPTHHMVGDSHGWKLNFDYAAWARNRHFRVGDTLVFQYKVGNHNVFKVSEHDFNACKIPPMNQALTTGNDVITLTTPGKKWYICGASYGRHCQMGQKLFIIVLPH